MSFEPIVAPFTSQQREAMQKIAKNATSEMDRKYSNGWPHFSGGGVKKLRMHNGLHARQAKAASSKAAQLIGMPSAEREALEAMMLAHDIIQLKARGVMERESGEWFVEQVHSLRILPEKLAVTGALVIRGTEPIFQGKLVVGQMCDRLSFPTKSDQLMALCGGTGDMAELNSAGGPLQGHLYAQELNIPWTDILSWQQKEIEIRTDGYKHLPIRKAESVLWKPKKAVIEYSHAIYKRIERGEITSYNQVLEEDVAFKKRHS